MSQQTRTKRIEYREAWNHILRLLKEDSPRRIRALYFTEKNNYIGSRRKKYIRSSRTLHKILRDMESQHIIKLERFNARKINIHLLKEDAAALSANVTIYNPKKLVSDIELAITHLGINPKKISLHEFLNLLKPKKSE